MVLNEKSIMNSCGSRINMKIQNPTAISRKSANAAPFFLKNSCQYCAMCKMLY